MKPVKSTQHQPEESLLHQKLRQEFDKGETFSRDPKNAALPNLYARTTTMNSDWYTRTCPECGLSFREEDRVRLCPDCHRAYHDDERYNLCCWHAHFAEGAICTLPPRDIFSGKFKRGCNYVCSGSLPDEDQRLTTEESDAPRIREISDQFFNGLQNTWTAFGDQSVIIVAEDDDTVGQNCPWCRFQIRTGDRVVKCPCGQCNTYFHDDIFRHLICWDKWNASKEKNYCPTSGAKIDPAILQRLKEGHNAG
ncbi:MAG: hypothetical protein GY796_28170 [Chloroflexi bacterium]|nr:hypothetical protein [Chloroflexota bacterium]